MNKEELKDFLFRQKWGIDKDLLREMLAVSLTVIITLAFWTLFFGTVCPR